MGLTNTAISLRNTGPPSGVSRTNFVTFAFYSTQDRHVREVRTCLIACYNCSDNQVPTGPLLLVDPSPTSGPDPVPGQGKFSKARHGQRATCVRSSRMTSHLKRVEWEKSLRTLTGIITKPRCLSFTEITLENSTRDACSWNDPPEHRNDPRGPTSSIEPAGPAVVPQLQRNHFSSFSVLPTPTHQTHNSTDIGSEVVTSLSFHSPHLRRGPRGPCPLVEK